MKKWILLTVANLFIFTGCSNRGEGARERMMGYFKYRFEEKQEKGVVESYLTGDLLESVKSLNEADYGKFIETSDERLSQLQVVDEKCGQDDCTFTVIIKYRKAKEQLDAKGEVKKIVKMKKQDGAWKISDIQNIKTYFDLR